MFIRWLRSLRRFLELSATNSRRERRARPHRLLLERLEDRTVPTFVALTGSKITMPVTSPAFQPFSVAVGDFTGNGVQDLAFGNGTTPGLIDIQQGLGNGTFQNAGTVSLGSSIGFVRYIAAADLTNDGGAGRPDLITADFDGNDVSILQNTTTSPGATPTFALVATIPVGSQPFGVITGDFSGDGLQDIVTANNAGNSITIIPNTSTGPGNISFGTPITIALPSGSSSPRSVEPIEINGKLDLVTANFNSTNLSLFQNTSTGPGNIGFNPTPTTISLPSGVSPAGLAIGDFTNNGLPDIAVGNDGSASGNIYLLLNQGNGTFASATAITIPGVTKAQYPIAADFNGDGNTDLAIVGETSNNVSILYGNGTGAFPTVETYATGSEPWMVASGDFNGDGAPDLVEPDIGDDLATVYLNQATASSLQVTPSTTSPDVNTPFTVTVAAQANGTTYQNYNGTVTLSDSNGTLGTHTFVPSDKGSYTFTVSLPSVEADTLTASDGTLTGTAEVNSVDPAITLSAGPLPADTVNVLYPTQTISASGGTGTLTLTTSVQNAVGGLIAPSTGTGSIDISGKPTATGTETFSVTATDAYGGTTTTDYSITVNSAVTFSPATLPADTIYAAYNQTITASGGTGAIALTVGTIPNAIPGLTVSGSGTSNLTIGGTPTTTGTETFTVTATDSLGGTATANYSIIVGSANTFVAATDSPISMPSGFAPYAVAAADLNGDGINDLVFGNGSYPGVLNVMQGQGNGTFQSAQTITIGTASVGFVRNVAAVDLTDDGGVGLPDLIAAEFGGSDVVILQNTTAAVGATPTFSIADTIPVGSEPFWVATGDFSGDGLQDIAVANFGGNSITIIPNTSTGPGNISFGTPITINMPSGSDPRSVEPIELNGKLDLVTGNWNNATLSILQNTSTGPGNISFTVGSTIALPSGSKPMALAIGDFNNDGQPDIAVADQSTGIDVLLNQNGTFPSATRIPITGLSFTLDVVAGDFNGDGNTDLAVAGQTSNNIAVLYGNGAGAFPTVETYAVGSHPWEIAAGDLNGDGAPDLVVANEASGTATVLLNQATASSLQVTPSTTSPDVNIPFTVTVAAQANGTTYQNYNGTVTLSDSSGTLGAHTFVPSDKGSYTFTVSLPSVEADTLTATDGTLTGTAQLNSVDPAITLSGGPLPADTVNASYATQTISASGGTGALTLTTTVQNAVPGLVIPSTGTGSIDISGSPTGTGTETFSVKATDAYGGTTTTSYSITVNAAPTLSALSTVADTTGLAYSQTITASGGTGAVTLSIGSVVGSIPGLNLPGPGSSLAIAFTPTGAGTITFEVIATDALGAATTGDYSITVRNPVPTLSNVGFTAAVSEGNQATLTGTINAPASEPLTLDVNWGDGSATQIFDLPAGTTAFSEPHTYAAQGSDAVSVTVGDSDFSNDLLYGSTGGASPNPGRLYVFDLANGSETLVGNLPGQNVTEITANASTGHDWLEYGANLYEGEQFNINTGAAIGSVIANVTHDNFNAMTYIGNTLYAAGTPATGGTSPSSLFTLDPATGTATLIGATGINGPISGIAYDAVNGTLYGIEGGSTSPYNLVSLNLTTGAATVLFSAGTTSFGSLSFGPDGNLYAGTSTGLLDEINPANQTVTPLSFTALPSAVSGLTMGNDTGNLAVTVNHTPPTLTISGNSSVDETATYTLNLSGSEVGPETISQWTVTWGDGSPAQTVTGNLSAVTHVYAEGPNDYTIRATATDQDGTYDAGNTVAVTIDHVPPILSISGAGMVNAGSVYTLNLAGSEPVAPHAISQWTINWGDGSTPQVVTGNALSVTHVFAIAAKDTISASASDDVGTYGAADTVAVVVTNWAEPTLSISGAASVNEGAVYTLALAGKPVAGQPIRQWTINWGDGAAQTVTGNPTKVTHVYAIGPNNYTISAAATDTVGTYAVAKTVSVAVKHVTPVVTFSGAASVNEGAVYALTLAGKDTHAITQWVINWGDGSPLQIATGNPTSVTHIYAVGPHRYIINASATDDIGTYRAANTLAVAVKHVPPVLAIFGPAEIAQGSTYTLDLTATVTADHAISKWIINWGDGNVQTVTGNPLSVTHVYLTGPSTHVIHASAVDNVGTYSAGDTVAVKVDHVAPTLTISGAASVNEKAVYTLDLLASAPGTVAIKKWTIFWGDGAVQTVTGNPTHVTHVYAVGPNSYTIVATATDPEGTYAALATLSVTVNHVAPTLTISGPASVAAGSVYTLKLSSMDTHPISQWTINWGDGTFQTVTGNPKTVTHVYATGAGGSYVISATATDEIGTYGADDDVKVTVKGVNVI